MKQLLKNKAVLGAICIFLSAAIAFVALPRLYRAERATTEVIQLKTDVEAGTILTEDMLSTISVGAYGVPDHVVKEQQMAEGQVTTRKLYAGEFLWQDSLMSQDEYREQSEKEAMGLTIFNCLVTIKLPGASSGVAGVLRAGDIVDVYSYKELEDGTNQIEKELESIYIYDVLNSDFESLTKLDEQILEDTENTSYNYEPVYALIRCSEEEAATLISLEKSEALHMTLRETGE